MLQVVGLQDSYTRGKRPTKETYIFEKRLYKETCIHSGCGAGVDEGRVLSEEGALLWGVFIYGFEVVRDDPQMGVGGRG